MNKKITIIGGGNMGKAIAQGLVSSGFSEAHDITITRSPSSNMEDLQKMGYNTLCNNNEAVKDANFIILAVKPYLCKDILAGFANQLNPHTQSVISIAASITLDELTAITGDYITVARIIPNTAIELCKSMSCISTNKPNSENFQTILTMFSGMGTVEVLDDSLMNAATALASCGTAFFLRMIRAMEEGAVQTGIKPKTAQKIAAQTAYGAAALLLKATASHTEAEIDKVTTPGGITIKGLNEMERNGMSSAIIQGLITASETIQKKK